MGYTVHPLVKTISNTLTFGHFSLNLKDWHFTYFCVAPWSHWWFGISHPMIFPLSGFFHSFCSLFTHVLGHGDWGHLLGNMTNLFVIGCYFTYQYYSLRM